MSDGRKLRDGHRAMEKAAAVTDLTKLEDQALWDLKEEISDGIRALQSCDYANTDEQQKVLWPRYKEAEAELERRGITENPVFTKPRVIPKAPPHPSEWPVPLAELPKFKETILSLYGLGVDGTAQMLRLIKTIEDMEAALRGIHTFIQGQPPSIWPIYKQNLEHLIKKGLK